MYVYTHSSWSNIFSWIFFLLSADTLYRYHYILEQEGALLSDTDVVYYLDVDLRVVQRIRLFEVAPLKHRPLVAVRHMLQDGRGTPESRPESRAYMEPGAPRLCYFAGGLVGGRTEEFVEMAEGIRAAIDEDDGREVVAIWHDESHLNKYLSVCHELVAMIFLFYVL